MTNLETLDKEAQVLRATIDAKRVDEASSFKLHDSFSNAFHRLCRWR